MCIAVAWWIGQQIRGAVHGAKVLSFLVRRRSEALADGPWEAYAIRAQLF